MKALTLDIWGTLLTDSPEFLQRQNEIIADHMKMDAVLATKLVQEADSHFTTLTEQTGQDYGFADRMRRMNHQISEDGISAVRTELYQALFDLPPLFLEGDQTLETLKKISTNGTAICLVSNTGFIDGTMMRKILLKIGILPLVQDTVFSNEVGYGKPHKSIFNTALRTDALRNTPIDDVLHVGDSLVSDYQGAIAANIRCLVLNTTKREFSDDISRIDSIKRLEDL